MSFPQFSRLLPYRDYNQESGLFMNDTTMGFMLEAIPINGANESIVEALDHMLRTKLPRGIPLCIHLMSSQLSRPCGMTQKWWCWSWADWKTVRHCWLR
ncbi:TraC family protein [Escherichia coli]|uniref:TraC family protein n=2 Tax=Escherichia coli TaxID=562 RepID=UPI0027D1FC1B|nr:TraC family protein [Escherichia coli]